MAFIVAEIGVNWDGNLELAKDMMMHVKSAGGSAVKFQAYTEDMVKSHPEHNRLVKSSITKFNVEEINKLAKYVGIEWFCTPMYVEAVDFLEPFVQKFKIRELDGRLLLNDQISDLLERALRTDKEIIVSSQQSPRGTKYFKHPKIKWLYVVPKYPCQLTDLNFKKINEFDGYSNHCPEIIAPLTAAILGSKIIEVHITSDKSKNFIDNNVSFNYEELSNLIKLISLSEKITI
ncbi:NeuB family protein [uncultured archaeon]|nr:NeuB family protein [uncultured archaeon]